MTWTVYVNYEMESPLFETTTVARAEPERGRPLRGQRERILSEFSEANEFSVVVDGADGQRELNFTMPEE